MGGLEGLDPGERAVLEELEGCAAACADVIDAIGKSELTDRGRAVATSDDREPPAVGDCFGYGSCSRYKRTHLEDAHRSVPKHSRRNGHNVGVSTRRLRTDV